VYRLDESGRQKAFLQMALGQADLRIGMRLSESPQVHPLKVRFAKGVNGVVEIEPVDIEGRADHCACPKKQNPASRNLPGAADLSAGGYAR
jgi:hypothetical protein